MLASTTCNTSVADVANKQQMWAAKLPPHEIHRSRSTGRSIKETFVDENSASANHTPEIPLLDDLDLMICHEEFTNLVALADKLKRVQRAQQSSVASIEYYEANQLGKANSSLAPAEVVAAVERMQEQLSVKHVVIRRGMYPLTDAMMDDNFSILQQELELCESCIRTAETKKDTIEATAAKYPKWQTDILMKWVVENKGNPFPGSEEIEQLSSETGLSRDQIINWTTNVRMRSRKATLGGKKPHHFMDWVFLAQQRDEQNGDTVHQPSANPSQATRSTLSAETSIRRTGSLSSIPSVESPHRRKRPWVLCTPKSSSQALGCQKPESSPRYGQNHYLDTPYIPYTPPSQNYCDHKGCGHSQYLTPAKKPWSTGGNWSTKRPRLSIPTLKSVSESFDENNGGGDSMLDPIIIDEEIDEDILSVFAASWEGTPRVKKQPAGEMAVETKQETLPEDSDEGKFAEALNEVILDPPQFMLEASLDWKEFELDLLS